MAYRDADTGHGWDLHGAIVPNPLSTFFMRAQGDGLRGHGIHSGDLLVIDRSLPLRSGAVVVIAQGGHFLVRPLTRQGENWLVLPLNQQQPALPMAGDRIESSGLFGVVAHVVHHLNRHEGRGRRFLAWVRRRLGAEWIQCWSRADHLVGVARCRAGARRRRVQQARTARPVCPAVPG
jgi:hypothetical protein